MALIPAVKTITEFISSVKAEVVDYGSKNGSKWFTSLVLFRHPTDLGECPTNDAVIQAFKAKLN